MVAETATKDEITVRAVWYDQDPELIECFRVSLGPEALSTKSVDGNERVIPLHDCKTIQIYPTGATSQNPIITYAPPQSGEILVNVRWHDALLEEFKCDEVRFGSDLLWMRLLNGGNRHTPLRSVRWFSVTPESHEKVTQVE